MRIMRARDLMTRDPRTVDPDLRLPELEEVFTVHNVSGLPVVKDGALIGIVCRSDIVRQLRVEQNVAETVSGYYREASAVLSETEESLIDVAEQVGKRIENLRVRDMMVTSLITVPPDEPVWDIARKLVDNRIHRVLVTDRHRLVGIVTTFDLARILAEETV